MITQSEDPYISKLEAEKEALQEKIRDIQKEIRTINSLIYRRKSEFESHTSGVKINKKNSERLMYESLILDLLDKSKDGLRTKEIYDRVTRIGYSVNYNTLRNYVVRLRDKSKIKKSSPYSYYWKRAD